MVEIKPVVDNFFIQYNSWGRDLLDYLHSMFNSIFIALLVLTTFISLIYIGLSLYSIMKKKDSEDDDTGNHPFVTVQIPTYNELVALRCASKCLEFDYPKEKYEILIGDDSNDKKVSKKIDLFAEKHDKIRVFRRGSNYGYKSGNLNNLLLQSKGEIIVIFDSDFIPPADFLKRIVKPFEKDVNVAGVQAKWNFINAEQNMVSILGTTIVEVFQRITLPFMYHERKIGMLCGSAEAIRKDTLIKLGGWDNGNLTEDIEYSLRLIKKGYRIIYLEDLKCDSEVPYLAKDLYRQQMRWAYGVVSSYKMHAKDIFTSKKIAMQDKVFTSLICSGYFITILLASLFLTGLLSVITHPPAPIDLIRFFSETARNTILTGGLIAASFAAVLKAKKPNQLAKMIASSLTYGIVVTYYVNAGIIKAIFKKPMEWHMLKKLGNTQ